MQPQLHRTCGMRLHELAGQPRDQQLRFAAGRVQVASRPDAKARATAGGWGPDSPVFDLGVTTVGDWRRRFERPARECWHAALL